MAQSVGINDVYWSSGFWFSKFKLCYQTMVPTMLHLMTETQRQQFLGNFLVASGVSQGEHRGPKFNDGDFYKFMEAVSWIIAANKDQNLETQLDTFIDIIGKAQRSDGYIHTDIQIAVRNGKKAEPFTNPKDFEMYNMGHLITAACVHYRATGKNSMLNIAIKAADFLDKTFAEPTPQQARNGICPSHLMALIDLYRLTDNKRYLELAKRLLNMRDIAIDGDDDNQDRIPVRKQTIAAGHAVRATYLYAGTADIYAETGDSSLLEALQSIWRDITTRKLYITGGCGALYDGASPDGSVDQKIISRVHQAFGRNYQLPNSTAHNECCAAIGNLLFNWRMFLISGESRFADVIEQTLFNSVLAGVSLDGSAFFYTNTLRRLNPMPVDLRWSRQRQKFISVFCCPPNSLRTIAQSSHYAYAIKKNAVNDKPGVFILLYGSSRLNTRLTDGTVITLRQETDYPWDGSVSITIESDGEFSLILRIPQWAEGATVSSKAHENPVAVKSGEFFQIFMKWSAGNVVKLELPMQPRLVEANPFVEEARNQVAVVRGPIVYCLESTDLPKDVNVLDVFIRPDIKLTSRKEDSLLGGVAVVEGKALVTTASTDEWTDHLYRVFVSRQQRELNVTFVPYFVWGNRGDSEMTVWISFAR